MDESQKTTPERGRPALDINKLFLPGAILLAGILVSGTILYTNMSKAQLGAGDEQSGEGLTSENLKKWAKELKLNSAEFNKCVDEHRYAGEIQKDVQDGSALGVTGTPTFFINGEKIVGAQPYDAFRTVIDAALARTTAAPPSPVDDDAVLGDPNAKVTMVEFSDFECPFCQRFWSETLSQIKRDYVDTGKMKIVYRDFPLSFHPGAQPAAEAAECAKEQGKFWEMHDLIFAKQQ